jgi:hypothetical protein
VAALDAGGEGKRRWAAAVSLENRVNTIPAMISAQIWLGRKRARRGTRLGARNGAPGTVEGGQWRGVARRRR